MKKTEIKKGMRIFREKGIAQAGSKFHDKWTYGTVISEAFPVPNCYRQLWKARVRFDNGREADIPINQLKESKRETD